MYNPPHFAESRPAVLQELIRSHPLATLVTLSDEGLTANHIPLLMRQNGSEFGSLIGHVARANPVWRATKLEVPVLAIFQGPQAYISPNWYPTKVEHGKVVPTWNYCVVQARGVLHIHDDPLWIRQQATALTQQQEADQPKPWAVDDAPRDYTDTLLRALVGIEVVLTQMTGKWKVSQNQPAVNQHGVVQALEQQGTSASAAMSALVRSKGPELP